MSANATLKRRARELLEGIDGIRSIGFAWDVAGNQVLQIDLSPDTDRAAVKRQLDRLDADVKVREISGTIRGD